MKTKKRVRHVPCMNANCSAEVSETALYCGNCKRRDMESKQNWRAVNKGRVSLQESEGLNKILNNMQTEVSVYGQIMSSLR
jgi:hypothetical protein